jgi:uncharacterized membrane protein YphA (DoxX/SURF4 family)
LTELVGGILLVLGLFTRAAAFAVVIFMLNADGWSLDEKLGREV